MLLIFALFISLLVILSNNILVSVLFLILLFIFSSIFYLFLGAEFLAFLLLIVYVGAISILFLFVIMLLDIRTLELQNTFFNYFSICFILGFFFLSNFFFILEGMITISCDSLFFLTEENFTQFMLNIIFSSFKTNLDLFGEVLYNHLFFFVYIVVYYLLVVLLIVLLIIFNRKFLDFYFRNRKFLFF